MKLVHCLLLIVALCASPGTVAAQQHTFDPARWKALQWRSIGPFRGGRVTAVAGVPSQTSVYYFGATGGGVWKTTDGGFNWAPVSDGQFKTGSVGAIGVSESDPNIIYVGMGESPIRGNVSHGDGVYKSTDAGKTWKHTGLADTHQISRVRVHPRNPDVIYVAAQGHVFGESEQRGIFRSKDGGKTWQKILSRGLKAGATDLVFDPNNAAVLYVGLWQVKRTPYSLESGGPDSGLFKSTDSGDTWTELTHNQGLPKGIIGNIGIAVSPVNSERVYAIVEAEDGGVFRSDNGGKNWTRVNEERRLRQRAWYYTRIYADPQKLDTVYVLNTSFHRSNDGGHSYKAIPTPHGDNHDLWIAPNDPQRMIEGNDGGANVTINGGATWTTQDQQPTGQFYRVALDQDFPYHVYGAQQDNSTIRIAGRTTRAGIEQRDWYDVGGGESGWIAPDPKDSGIVFAGSYDGLITRYDDHTGEFRNVTPWPDNSMGWAASPLKYRFQWNFPLLFSAHDPNTLYAAANVLFKSMDQGQSWEVISPDLTRNDKSKQGSSGGPITKDNTSIEYYCTIFTVMESPVQKGLIWTGSDDGLVYITRDGGKNWSNVTPKGMPEWIQINSIEASPHNAASAYIAATMYKWDDRRPYLYKTADYGKTWQPINNGIPDGAFTRVIREDSNRRGLLYAGTETGIYVSFDDGANWQSLQLNLPVVPITDLAVHKRERELVAATQGRAFWILDDLPLLHQAAIGPGATEEAHLFRPKDTYRLPSAGFRRPGAASGQNPPGGAVIYYYLKTKPAGDITLELLDSAGKPIKTFSSKSKETEPAPAGFTPEEDELARPPRGSDRLETEIGLNRFVWDLRYPDASRFPGMILWAGSVRGPLVAPGVYQAKLTAGGKSQTQNFMVKKDPRLAATPEDFARQLELSLQIRDKLSQTNDAVVRIRDVRKQVEEYGARFQDAKENGLKLVRDRAKALAQTLTAIEEELYQTKNRSSQDPLNYPIRLNNKLAALGSVVAESESAPTKQSRVVYEELATQINAQLQKLDAVLREDLTRFNQLVREQNIPAVAVK